MSSTLYRKYRPQSFHDVVGQLHVRTTLLAELAGGVVAHAFLFVGPRGVGKTTVARLLAKAVNCTAPKDGEPDNRCQSCQAIQAGRSLDLIEIDAASHTQVDHVREHILPAARTAPTIGRYKVFIIDEVHMLSVSAFNALLKILEEPPAHVIFILATTEVHRIPATIISRCQRFDFRRVGFDDTIKRLTHVLEEEGVRADRAVLERIARLSQGSLRDAESMLGQLTGLGEKHLTADIADVVLPRSDIQSALQLLDAIIAKQPRPALELIQRLVDEGTQIAPFMRECIEAARSVMLINLGVQQPDAQLAGAEAEQARNLASRTSAHFLERVIDVLMRRERDERYASLPQVPLELAVVELSVADEASTLRVATTAPVATAPRKRESSGSAAVSKSFTEVSAQWKQVIDHVSTTNPSVGVLLKSARPRGIVSGTLTMAVPFVFHRERMLETRTYAMLKAAAEVVFKAKLDVEVVVEESSSAAPTTDVWQQALNSFGGQLANRNKSA